MSEAILMAYVDDELGPRERAAIEAKIAVDPDLAHRAERHRRLRVVLQAAYGDDHHNPVADTLLVLPIGAGRRKRPWWRFWR